MIICTLCISLTHSSLSISISISRQAWNNSPKSYKATLSVYHSYLLRKNHDSLPALITGTCRGQADLYDYPLMTPRYLTSYNDSNKILMFPRSL